MDQQEKKDSYLGTIRKITEELTSTLDIEEVLQHIVRLTAEAVGVKGCSLRLLNEKTRQFDLSAAWGLSPAYLSKGPIDADHSMSACMKGGLVHILDAKSDLRVQYPEDAQTEGIVSMLSVPMLSVGRVLGVLRLYTSETRDFERDELEFVQTLADLGTLALEHERLYTGLKEDHAALVEDFHAWFEASTYHPA